VKCREAIRFFFADLQEAAVFAILWKADLIVDAFPVHPIRAGNAFILAARKPVMIIVDDVLLADANRRGAFGPRLGDRLVNI